MTKRTVMILTGAAIGASAIVASGVTTTKRTEPITIDGSCSPLNPQRGDPATKCSKVRLLLEADGTVRWEASP